MNFTIKFFTYTFLFIFIFSCKPSKTESVNSNEKTISGIVESIEDGKDGYTAQLTTRTGEIYSALVSITNLGGMQNYARLNPGDRATLRGELWNSNNPHQMKVIEIVDIKIGIAPFLIQENSFEGITVGDRILSHASKLTKSKLQNGEGFFDIYRIQSKNNNSLAYFFPDPNDEMLVGNITIDSPKAKTANGIRIGNTLADLQKKYPSLEVHGSEIEGRTYAFHGNLSYRLDTSNFSYEVDISKIDPSTKITEIVINR